ncbi:MAG: phosphoglucosamine mutase [Bacteroidales bacterium]|nr:phosphoglucosamine mutase [Bacteroidales bacterium]
MTLIKSISGIRGTIGGAAGTNFTPADIERFTSAFVRFIKNKAGKDRIRIVIGRDARKSGQMVNMLVSGAAMAMGADVIDGGMLTTPTVEMAVPLLNADAGIIITASHNPGSWNALKLLNEQGEFISDSEGRELLRMAEGHDFRYVPVDDLGSYSLDDRLTDMHIERIIQLPAVNLPAIRKAGFSVAVDAVNSVGGVAVPRLLKKLGVDNIGLINCEPDGNFAHNPEPLPENLKDLSERVTQDKMDMGFAVDPDVDRLAIIDEKGNMFGEEYTLVAVADYILQRKAGNTVSNLSSTRALKDITLARGGKYYASPVGEVNVVELMKEKNAVIGGEGNGGVILPELHYGRDALAGIALFLSYLAGTSLKVSELRKKYPDYSISKNKIEIPSGIDLSALFKRLSLKYEDLDTDTRDGIKIDLPEGWVHLRRSNTEPIIRIYAESHSPREAEMLAEKYIHSIREEIDNLSGLY